MSYGVKEFSEMVSKNFKCVSEWQMFPYFCRMLTKSGIGEDGPSAAKGCSHRLSCCMARSSTRCKPCTSRLGRFFSYREKWAVEKESGRKVEVVTNSVSNSRGLAKKTSKKAATKEPAGQRPSEQRQKRSQVRDREP